MTNPAWVIINDTLHSKLMAVPGSENSTLLDALSEAFEDLIDAEIDAKDAASKPQTTPTALAEIQGALEEAQRAYTVLLSDLGIANDPRPIVAEKFSDCSSEEQMWIAWYLVNAVIILSGGSGNADYINDAILGITHRFFHDSVTVTIGDRELMVPRGDFFKKLVVSMQLCKPVFAIDEVYEFHQSYFEGNTVATKVYATVKFLNDGRHVFHHGR